MTSRCLPVCSPFGRLVPHCDSLRRMNRSNIVNALAGLRIAVGAASWLTPRPAGKLLWLDSKANPQAPYLARLFGARDIALAYGAMSSEGETQRQWLTA